MGVCDCEGETILVACVHGGLLFCVTINDGASRTWARFGEAQAGADADADEVIADEAQSVDSDGGRNGPSAPRGDTEAATPVGEVGTHVDAGPCVDAGARPDAALHVDAGPRTDAIATLCVDLSQQPDAHPHEGVSPGPSPHTNPTVDAQPHAHANLDPHADLGPYVGAGPDGPNTPTVLGRAKWALTLDRWNFATVMFMVMFEVEDPTLIQAVVRSVIAWTGESGRRVVWSGERWPWALSHPKTGALRAFACAERQGPQAWLCAQPECGGTGPRGPPPWVFKLMGRPPRRPTRVRGLDCWCQCR